MWINREDCKNLLRGDCDQSKDHITYSYLDGTIYG